MNTAAGDIYFVHKMSLSVCLVETWHTVGVVCYAGTSEAVKAFRSFDTLLENCFDRQKLFDQKQASISTSFLDAGTILVSVPPFVYCHCTWRWAVLDNTQVKDSRAFA